MFVILLVLLASPAWAGPNFVLCMTDDQGYRDAGYMGHPVLKTPVLDDMASKADAREAIPAIRKVLAEAIRPPNTVAVIIGEKDLAWFIQMSAGAFISRVAE